MAVGRRATSFRTGSAAAIASVEKSNLLASLNLLERHRTAQTWRKLATASRSESCVRSVCGPTFVLRLSDGNSYASGVAGGWFSAESLSFRTAGAKNCYF